MYQMCRQLDTFIRIGNTQPCQESTRNQGCRLQRCDSQFASVVPASKLFTDEYHTN
jgi:hypothetical protein